MMQDSLQRVAMPAAPPLEGAAPRWPAKLVGLVTWSLRGGVIVSLVAILVLTVLQVLDRHVLQHGFAFDQYSRVGLVWLAFLGIALGFREKANIRVDLLDHFLPRGLVKPQRVVLDLVVLVVALALLWFGWQLLEIGSFQVLMDTPLTYQVMYGAALAGLVLLCLFLAVRLIDVLTGGRLGLDTVEDGHDHH